MKYTLYFYENPGDENQIKEELDSNNEEVLTETITAILDCQSQDPERMYHLYDADNNLILTEEICEL